MMEKKNKKVLSIIASVILVVICIGATYAYFVAQTGDNKSVDVNVTANTVDVFSFEVGDPVSISINQENFASGTNSMSDTTYAKALLTANNKTNTATRNYYLYLNITNNTLTYSLNTSTPEVLLTITDGSGTAITSLTGLDYKTVTDAKGVSVSGFDITTKSGLITLLDNRTITTTSTKEETWNVKMTFINHTHNQAANAGKSITAKLLIQKEKLPQVLADVCTNGSNLAACIKNLSDNSYSNLTSIYKHDTNLTNGAKDNSYRYAGSYESVNNYVCFGSSATTCPDDNLYRIIGVFGDQVKLIKWDYATSTVLGTSGAYSTLNTWENIPYLGNLTTINTYYWSSEGGTSNVWSGSALNTTNLNGTYLTNLGTTWANKIADTSWKVGGNTEVNIARSPMNTAYQNEIVSPAANTTYSAKIGLMYVSDYGYAASPTYWTYYGYNESNSFHDYRMATYDNWIFMGISEFTITRVSNWVYFAFYVSTLGRVESTGVDGDSNAVRPTFYLNANVTYSSGTGEKNSPIRIN